MTEKGDAICPTPTKSRFATMTAAISAAQRAQLTLMKNLYPYEECPCGWIHLTSRAPRERRDPVLGNGAVDDTVFMLVVRDDVGGWCAESDSALLRTPEYVKRWSDGLKTYQVSLEAQLASKQGKQDDATKEWRARIKRIQLVLRERRLEAQELRRQYHAQGPCALPSRRSPDVKERRRQAGERAVRRLKDAHSDEFMTYLAEEYVAEGLPMGGKLAEYAPGGVSE